MAISNMNPDVISALRKKNLFSNGQIPMQQSPSSAQQTSVQQSPQDSNLGLNTEDIEILRNLFNPETEATKRFADLIGNQPTRERPSLGRTLVASGIGLKSGAKAAGEIMQEPHTRAMEDWNARMGPAQQAANLERQSSTNERQLLGGMVTASREQQRLKETTRLADERNRIAQDRLNLERMKAEGWEFDFSGPYVFRFKKDGTHENTGVRTENLSEADKMILRSQLDTNRALILENEDRITRNMPIPDENLSASQADTRRQTDLRRLYETNVIARKWISERNGVYSLADRPELSSSVFSRVTPEDIQEYEQIIKQLNPDRSVLPTGGATATTDISGLRQNNQPPSTAIPRDATLPSPIPNRARGAGPGPRTGSTPQVPNAARLRQEAIEYLRSKGINESEQNIQFYIERMR